MLRIFRVYGIGVIKYYEFRKKINFVMFDLVIKEML